MRNSQEQEGLLNTKRRGLVLVYSLSPEQSRPWIEQALRCNADAKRVTTLNECEALASSSLPTVITTEPEALTPRFFDRYDAAFGAISLVLLSDATSWNSTLGMLGWQVVPREFEPTPSRTALEAALMEATRRHDERERVRDYHRRCDSLSTDERGVFNSVCAGRLNKQIAGDMQVSVRTIEQRRRRVFQKMGVDSAVPLAAMRSMVETLESQWRRIQQQHPDAPQRVGPPSPHLHDAARSPSEAGPASSGTMRTY